MAEWTFTDSQVKHRYNNYSHLASCLMLHPCIYYIAGADPLSLVLLMIYKWTVIIHSCFTCVKYDTAVTCRVAKERIAQRLKEFF